MMPYQIPKSDEMAERGRRVIPAATMSNFRRSVDYRPIYLTHGIGARFYDLDGNEYIDYNLGYGPAVLGYDNPHLRQALHRQVDRLYAPNVNDMEVLAAEKVARHIACAELVRFTCSGTEAVSSALRVARAFTNRPKYVRFSGHYHGGLDELMGGIVLDPSNPAPVAGEFEDDPLSQFTNTLGRYDPALEQCFLIEWNDLDRLAWLLETHGEQIAAVIMEPVMVNSFGCMPEPGYLEGVRELCTRHGALLIFDEILTGFRIGLKGAQGFFGVTPDLATLGKALAAGLPVSAFCGRREVMDTLTRADAVVGGTYNGHPLAMAGLVAAIEEYERDEGAVFRHIEKVGNLLKDGLEQIAAEHGQPLLMQGFPGSWTPTFLGPGRSPSARGIIRNQAEGRGSDFKKKASFYQLIKKRGVIFGSRLNVSAAHTEKDVSDTLERANEAMRELREEREPN